LAIEGEDSEMTADYYYDIRSIHSQMYNPSQADIFFKKSMNIYKKSFGEESVDVVYIHMNLGINATKMANYHEADKHYAEALRIFKESTPPTCNKMYRFYSNYGLLFRMPQSQN
jgi:tetratricopeptide (TPR) repeat protein